MKGAWPIALVTLIMIILCAPIAGAQEFSSASKFNIDPATGTGQASWSGKAGQGAISRADSTRSAAALPVGQAFTLQVTRNATGDIVNLIPAQGYLIYRHTLSFVDSSGNAIVGAVPQGKDYEDGEFGQVQVFSGPVRIELPAGRPLAVVRLQGCQSDGICYPPLQAVIGATGGVARLEPAKVAPAAAVGSAGGNQQQTGTPGVPSIKPPRIEINNIAAAPGGDASPSGGWLAQLMAGPAGLTGFLLVGLLMAFSPCLLPMLPVTVSLVAGRAHGGRWHMAPVAWFTLAHGAIWAVGGFLAAGSGGVLLSAQLQSPAFLAAGAGVFLLLGGWQMGWIRVNLPQWSGLPARWSEGGMGPMGAMALGATSALVLGPCAAPLLAGALLAVAQAGDPWMGATGLGLMGIGMCIPMLALAAGGTGLMTRMRQASAWITWVGACALWAVAMVLISRILGPALEPWLAGLWAIMAMGSLASQRVPAGRPTRAIAAALGVVVLGVVAMGLSGRDLFETPTGRVGSTMGTMQDVNAADLERWIAGHEGEAVVWVVADWCSVCKKFDRQTLSDERVAGRLGKMHMARVDITPMGEQEQLFLAGLGLIGPPGMLFYRDGREIVGTRLVGYEGAQAFMDRIDGAGGNQ